MNSKKLMLSLALVSVAVLATGAAHATCTVSGPVDQIFNNSALTYVYVRPANLTAPFSYNYLFVTNNAVFANTLNNSLHQNVTIYGNATTCPTSGSQRLGGSVASLYVN
jgi:hypothetical protein